MNIYLLIPSYKTIYKTTTVQQIIDIIIKCAWQNATLTNKFCFLPQVMVKQELAVWDGAERYLFPVSTVRYIVIYCVYCRPVNGCMMQILLSLAIKIRWYNFPKSSYLFCNRLVVFGRNIFVLTSVCKCSSCSPASSCYIICSGVHVPNTLFPSLIVVYSVCIVCYEVFETNGMESVVSIVIHFKVC